MQYFRNGRRIARVDTDAPLGEAFIAARAEVYSMDRDGWVPRDGITTQIVYTGDWNPCTEDEATDLAGRRRVS